MHCVLLLGLSKSTMSERLKHMCACSVVICLCQELELRAMPNCLLSQLSVIGCAKVLNIQFIRVNEGW
jgi:hypothetical protein